MASQAWRGGDGRSAAGVGGDGKSCDRNSSPQSGQIKRLFGEPGDIIRIGAPLASFEGEADASDDSGTVVGAVETGARVLKEASAAVGRGAVSIRATPAVRALASRLQVDLAIVTPSGPDGVITAGDVQRVARILLEAGPAEPLRGFRRAMAQNMALAQAEVAAATLMDDADIEAWPPGADTTIRLIRALVAGCQAEPSLNTWFEGRSLARRVLRKIDLGIAVDLPEGLFVPVLRDAANRDAADLRRGLDRMRADLAARRMPPEELRGNTITLSNFGAIGGKYAAPVVLPPTVAILGAGRIRPRSCRARWSGRRSSYPAVELDLRSQGGDGRRGWTFSRRRDRRFGESGLIRRGATARSRLPPARVSGEGIDNRAIGGLGERLQRLRPDVAHHAKLHGETRRDGVVRRFVNGDKIIPAHGQIDLLELSSFVLQRLFRGVEASG